MVTASSLIDDAAVLLGDAGKTYHTQEKLLRYLNRSLRDICNRTQCVTTDDTIAKIAGVYQYPLFTGFLLAHAVLVNEGRFYPLRRSTISRILLGRWVAEQGRPESFDIWGKGRIERTSGLATGGSSTSLEATDQFTSVLRGDLVTNVTDNSEATVTAVAPLVLAHTALQGGANNVFGAGDSYLVESAHRPNHILAIHPAPSDSDTGAARSIAVFYSKEHRKITQADIDETNDGLDIDVELETPLLHRVMYWARGEEMGESSNEATAQLTLYLGEMRRATPLVRNRIRQAMSSWKSRSADFIPRATGPERSFAWHGVDI